MQSILLLGAGFSRNWGGWLASEAFEYLLGCPEISQNHELRNLLWHSQRNGSFEYALSALQNGLDMGSVPTANGLEALQNAVSRMFDDMNRGFENIWNFEFTQEQNKTIRAFLIKFDAVFTLNQDLLLEHKYIGRITDNKWSGFELPGMQSSRGVNMSSWGKCEWFPKPATEHRITDRMQPYFKLHGSSNWRDTNGGSMLIMGGNKATEIGRSPILKWYHDQFEEHLFRPNTRLMVIGYGFRDNHINAIITRAVENGLKMFIIAPEGPELDPSRPGRKSVVSTGLEELFQKSLIGASRRSMREIFGSDMIEHNKVMRFFEA